MLYITYQLTSYSLQIDFKFLRSGITLMLFPLQALAIAEDWQVNYELHQKIEH